MDLIRLDGKLAGNWVEKSYPGVHSDVGGGYEPRSQQVDNNYARIPMRDMLAEALAAGVRVRYYALLQMNKTLFTERYELR